MAIYDVHETAESTVGGERVKVVGERVARVTSRKEAERVAAEHDRECTVSHVGGVEHGRGCCDG